jgi:hypothetical protein
MALRTCPNCGARVDSSWRYCPSCGGELQLDFFEDFFQEFNRKMRKMTGAIDHNFEAFDAKPMFAPTAGGFTLRVTRRNAEKPKVEVRTFGNVRPEDVTRQLQNAGMPAKRALPSKPFSEPQTKMTTEGGRAVIEMSLPKIESLKDIEIAKLESSIEVRAYGKEQGYFKIIAIPPEAQLVGKSFSGGVLRLEFAK